MLRTEDMSHTTGSNSCIELNRRGHRARIVCGAALLVLASCGGTSATSPTPSRLPGVTNTPPGYFIAAINDSVQGGAAVQCPAEAGAAAKCYVLVETGQSPQLGEITVSPVLDIEYPSESSQCGARQTFNETLNLTSGSILVAVSGPYLCLYDTGVTNRAFAVQSGTGKFAGVSGSGSIEFDTLRQGAVEQWKGTASTP